jgi:bifunctional non-homologous end joining protein LigD
MKVKIIKPMLAQSGHQYLYKPGWMTERKYDGFRVLAYKFSGIVRIFSRSGQEYTKQFPCLVRELQIKKADNFVFDGEIAYLDSKGNDIFEIVQKRLKIENPAIINEYCLKYPINYFVFDILYWGKIGKSIQKKTNIQRKLLLSKVFQQNNFNILKLVPHFFNQVQRQKLRLQQKRKKREGVVHKDPKALYIEDYRSPSWRKDKFNAEDDVVIIGYKYGKAVKNQLGAVYIATLDKLNNFVYRGKVGSGFSHKEIIMFQKRLDRNRVPEKFYKFRIPKLYNKLNMPEIKEIKWVKPNIIIKVEYFKLSKDGIFRQGVFDRLRPDKNILDLKK